METHNFQTSNVTILGQPMTTGRWLLIPLGMVTLLCLGSVYSWSIFRSPLETELGLSATQSLLPYTVALVFYAATMPIAGFYIPRIGTRLTAAIGGVVVGLGYILSSFTTQIGTLVVTYGAIAGIGVGITYGVPIVVAARWFPDRKGLAMGLTLTGFGLSPFITAPLANQLIQTYSEPPATKPSATPSAPSSTIPNTPSTAIPITGPPLSHLATGDPCQPSPNPPATATAPQTSHTYPAQTSPNSTAV